MKFRKEYIKYIVLIFMLLLFFVFLLSGTYGRYITRRSTLFKTEIVALGKVEISLAETKVDLLGVPLIGTEAGTTNSKQTYKLIPGYKYVKDPHITIDKGSNPCWLFVEVDNGIAAFEADTNTIYAQMIANGWTLLEGENNIYYHDIVDAFDEEKTVKVFDEFTIDGWANEVDGWDVITPENTNVSIRAYAIQADGFDDVNKTKEENAISAWAALKEASSD